jgi:hypothetical protein
MTADPRNRPGALLAPTPTLALAYERIAELRAAAERDRLVQAAGAPAPADRARRAWPSGLVAALRDSLATLIPSGAVRRERACPTC